MEPQVFISATTATDVQTKLAELVEKCLAAGKSLGAQQIGNESFNRSNALREILEAQGHTIPTPEQWKATPTAERKFSKIDYTTTAKVLAFQEAADRFTFSKQLLNEQGETARTGDKIAGERVIGVNSAVPPRGRVTVTLEIGDNKVTGEMDVKTLQSIVASGEVTIQCNAINGGAPVVWI